MKPNTSKEKQMINQLPFWCRSCEADYNHFDVLGVCEKCGTQNVLDQHLITVTIPVIAYSVLDAQANVEALIKQLIKQQLISPETTVL
jgi:hypothetical protein